MSALIQTDYSLLGKRTNILGNPDPISQEYTTGSGSAIITFFIIILIVLAIIALAYHFGFAKKGNTVNEACTTDANCEAFHFCSGDNTCQRGEKGVTESGTCSTSKDCVVGLTCQNEVCTAGQAKGSTGQNCSFNDDCQMGLSCQNGHCTAISQTESDLATFEKSNIIFMDSNGTKYYLNVTSISSVWQTTAPANTFSYSSSSNQLYIEESEIFIQSDGTMATVTSTDLANISPDATFIKFIRNGTETTFVDTKNNQIAFAVTPSTSTVAIFVDPVQYPMQTTISSGQQVSVEIEQAS